MSEYLPVFILNLIIQATQTRDTDQFSIDLAKIHSDVKLVGSNSLESGAIQRSGGSFILAVISFNKKLWS